MRFSSTLLLFFTLSISYAQIPCNGEFLTTGSAIDQGSCIQLTSNSPNQQGCTWLNSPVDFSQPFTHTMIMNFGNSDAGADGICLVYQTGGPNVCGTSGEGIGASGIPNSFIVEFDTWDNGAAQSDIAADHCATSINGDLNNQIDPPVSLGNIEDGANHSVTFSWNPAGTSYTISFDGIPIITGVYDIINLVFGGQTTAYWGYTSSTGAAFNTQSVCPSLPPPIVVDAGIDVDVPCVDGQITLDATGTATGATYVYSWSSPDGGQIISGGATLTPTVMGPGTYILTLTDLNGNCMETDEVVVNLVPIEAVIAPPPFVPCFGNTVFLDGSGSSSGPFITYQWTTIDGTIVSGANSPVLEIAAPGTYTLTVTYNDGNTICTEVATVQTIQDPNVPIAAAFGGEINCNFPTIQLDGSPSSSGPDYSYQWTTLDGLILSGANTQFPTVGAAGTYTLIVTNNFNGCFATTDVIVTEDTVTPVAVAIANDTLGCQVEEVTLDGTGSSTGATISYTWSTIDGNIVSGDNTLMPVVDAAGTYTLFVENTSNGCFAAVDVEVIGGAVPLVVTIAPADILTCSLEEQTLSASITGSSNMYTYSWTSLDGNIVSGETTLTPLINAPGTYDLSVTTDDGCVGTSSVEVFQEIMPPIAEAGPSDALSCDQPSLTLNGSNSSTGPFFSYQWSTADGNIISGDDSLAPSVNAPGTYFLQVTNTTNDCISLDSVIILNDAAAPTVSIDFSDTLDCNTSSLVLDGSSSSQGLGFSFVWATPDGNFASGETTLQPSVDAPGQYTLSVTNLNNNCTTISTVTVIQDTIAPIVNIVAADTLDCITSSLIIDATASSQGSNFAYDWNTSDGNIINGAQSLSPEIDAPGTYLLNILNTENGCSSTDQLEIIQDTISPLVSIVVTDTLDCAIDSLILDGSASSQGPSFNFTWAAANPSFLSGTNTLQPFASGAGNFFLTILNTENNCQSTAIVEVLQDTIAPIADAGPDMIINCYNETQILDGTASSITPEISYQWTGTGIDMGANTTTPTISTGDTYILNVINTSNSCESVDSVIVTENFDTPVVSILPPAILTCTDSLITMDASASSQGMLFEYNWTTTNGSIVSGMDTDQAVASQAGSYQLEILNTLSGCTAIDTVIVTQDTNFPLATITPSATLNCTTTSVQLNGLGSSQGSDFTFVWNTSNGSIASGANTLQPTVDAPGTYSLVITDLLNDCEAVTVIEVPIDTLAPNADAGATSTITCASPELILDGNNSDQGMNYTYSWTTPDGNIISGSNTLSPTIDTPGQYDLLVQNTDNGCNNTAMVTILEDVVVPSINIITPDVLSCTTTNVMLDASASDMVSFNWSTLDGNISNGANTSIATADQAGNYQLILINTQNGCADTSTVEVLQDTISPMAVIAPATILTCQDTILTLDGNSSSTGMEFAYLWSTADGVMESGNTNTQVDISAPGNYQLEITNNTNGCINTANIDILQNIVAPQITIAPPSILTCIQTDAMLEASILNAGNQLYNYNWSTLDGNMTAGMTAPIATSDAPGTYEITITDTENGCLNTTDIQVQQDTVAPTISITLPDTLTCFAESILLDATSSSSGFLFLNNWQTPDGLILNGSDELTPEIASPGTYTLMVENTANGCQSTGAIEVAQNISTPAITILLPDTLSCSQTSLNLDANGSSSGSTFAYNWSTTNGNILSGGQSSTPIIDEPGLYTLSIQDTHNGCVDSLSTLVAEDVLLPSLSINPPDILNCATTTLVLDGQQSSSGPEFEYLWTSSPGNITGPDNLSTAMIDEPGNYTLTVLNTNNGCSDSLLVMVDQDITLPEVTIETPEVLNCILTSQQLDGTASSSGTNFTYQWTTIDGNLTNGTTTNEPTINEPGNYTLIISNTANGCVDSSEVIVLQDITLPGTSILPPDTLSCALQTLSLTGSSQVPQDQLTFNWQTANGAITGATNDIMAQVIAPGTYVLTAINNNNGCQDSTSVLVAQDTISPMVAIADAALLTCEITSFSLDGTASDAGLYSWSSTDGNIVSGNNTSLPTIDEPGTYTLTVESLTNGCTAFASITVNEDVTLPSLNIALPDILTCSVETINIDASASSTGTDFEYSWEPVTGGTILEGETSLNPLVNTPGIYELTILNNFNGCSQNMETTVLQDIIPPIANAGTDFVLPCFEDFSELDGNGSSQGIQYIYQWNTVNGVLAGGSQGLSPSISSAGIYQLTVLNTENGCDSDDEVIVIQDIPTAQIDWEEPACFGDFGYIAVTEVQGGISPYLYALDGNNFQSFSTFANVTPGIYDVTVQDINGCEYQQDILIETPDSMVVISSTDEASLLLGESQQIILQTNIPDTSIASVNWNNAPSLSCYDCMNPIAAPSQTTDYRVVVVSNEGCSDEAYIRIYVDKQKGVYIPNIFSPNGDGANDVFYIYARPGIVKNIRTFQIFSRWGERLFKADDIMPNDPLSGWDGIHRKEHMNSAVFTYFAEIEFIDGRVEIFKGDIALFR